MIPPLTISNRLIYNWLGVAILAGLFPAGFAQITTETEAQKSPPSALEHAPAQLPTVTFRNGELTIVAYNSTLRDILEMVRTQTGAAIEIPPEATERVFVSLGPGPTRHVLDLLLAGSSFNYVLLGSAADPQALTKVVLSPKPSGNADSGAEADIVTTPAQRRFARHQVARAAEEAEPEPLQSPILRAADTATGEQANIAVRDESASKVETDESPGTAAAAPLASQQLAEKAQQPAEYPHTPNIKSAQEILQDLYARRQAMQHRQTTPQQ